MTREVCIACHGTGKCADCDGSGINTHWNQREPKCRSCAGSGTCSDCQGTGRYYQLPPTIQDLGLDKL